MAHRVGVGARVGFRGVVRVGVRVRLWLGLGLGFAVRVGARYTDTDVLEAI